MKSITVLWGALLALGAGLAAAPRPAIAAHAGAPYTNVDRSNDRGNDTGDLQVEGLNQRQLDQYHWSDAQRSTAVPSPLYLAPQTAPLAAPR